jgi:hypothetical protein
MSLEQTRGRNHDPCDEGGKAREQQQIMQDEGHRKSPLRASSNRSEQSCRQGDETGEQQQVVQGTDGHRSPALCSIPDSASQNVGQNVMEGWLN